MVMRCLGYEDGEWPFLARVPSYPQSKCPWWPGGGVSVSFFGHLAWRVSAIPWGSRDNLLSRGTLSFRFSWIILKRHYLHEFVLSLSSRAPKILQHHALQHYSLQTRVEYLNPRNSAIVIVFFYDDTLECLCWRYDKQSLFMVYLHCTWDDEEQNILSMIRFCVALVIQVL